MTQKTEKPVEPAGPDPDAEAQEEQRAMVKTHGENVPDPAPLSDVPEGEPVGYHEGPPKRINCPSCGHAHQISYDECQRCGASLRAVKKDAGIA